MIRPVYTRDQLLSLALTLSGYTGIALSTLSSRATGNDKVFPNLNAGLDCRMSAGERASWYFNTCWPLELAWPQGVPRLRGRPNLFLQGPRHRRAREAVTATA